MSTFIRRPKARTTAPRVPSTVLRALRDSSAATDAELLSALREHPSFGDVLSRIDAQISHRERQVRMCDVSAAAVNSPEAYDVLRKERDVLTAFVLLRAALRAEKRGA
jgi:hypothetical protein